MAAATATAAVAGPAKPAVVAATVAADPREDVLAEVDGQLARAQRLAARVDAELAGNHCPPALHREALRAVGTDARELEARLLAVGAELAELERRYAALAFGRELDRGGIGWICGDLPWLAHGRNGELGAVESWKRAQEPKAPRLAIEEDVAPIAPSDTARVRAEARALNALLSRGFSFEHAVRLVRAESERLRAPPTGAGPPLA